ncbi:TBC domain-containing protein [Cyclospora cayetanensis]|uniref:TBC domain-containing protein n=1 Tax=Cyclospora cayetanensis TaxID=88456 RepID=A0A1D3D145_9EIME|nr:TBC domain-containing protein [Cyclospora cayetanensis]
MYLSGWLLTLFGYSLSLECVARDELLSNSFEGILEILKVGPSRVSPSLLLETALQLKVRSSTLAALEAEYLIARAAAPLEAIPPELSDCREHQDRGLV